MNHHWYPEALQQHGQQGGQVGTLARTVVGGNDDRPWAAVRRLQGIDALVGGGEETDHFIV